MKSIFISKNRRATSNQTIFFMALGHVAPGTDAVNVALPLRKEAREEHIIEGLQNNLYSINKLVQADYIPIFSKD